MIPAELMSLAGGGVAGLLFKMAGQWMDNKRYVAEALAGRLEAEREERKSIRATVSKGFQWTRRIIALTLVGSYVYPKFWALTWGDYGMSTAYCYYQTKGLLFNLFATTPILQCQPLPITAITPMDTHMLAAVIGLYFGASTGVKK